MLQENRNHINLTDTLNKRAQELIQHNQDFPESLRSSCKAEKIAEKIDYQKGIGWALVNQTRCRIHSDLITQSNKPIKRAVKIFRELKDPDGESIALLVLGMTLLIDREYISAFKYLEEGLRISVETNNKEREKLACHFLAALSFKTEDYQSALAYNQRALAIEEDPWLNARILTKIAATLCAMEQFAKAKNYLEKALDSAKERDDFFSVACANVQLAKVYIGDSDAVKAKEFLRIGAEIAQKIGLFEGSILVAVDILDSYILLEDYDAAYSILKELRNSKRINENPQRLTFVLMKIIEVDLKTGKTESALELLDQIWEAEKSDPNDQVAYECQKAFTEVFKRKSDYKRAFEHQQSALEFKNKLESNGVSEKIRILADRTRIESIRQTTEAANLRADLGIALTFRDKSVNEVLQECADALYKNLDLVYVEIWRYDDDGLSKIAEKGERLLTVKADMPITNHLIERVASEKKQIFNDDVLCSDSFSNYDINAVRSANSFAGFPMLIGEKLIGVIGMYSRARIPSHTRRTMDLITDLMTQGLVRYKANNQLRQERDFYSAVIESSTGFMFVFDTNGTIVKLNKTAQELFTKKGVTEIVGKKIEDVTRKSEIGEGVAEWIRNFDLTSVGENYELKHIDKFGKPYYVSWCSDVILNEKDGSIKYIISNGTDLTNIRKSEEALRKSEYKLRKLFDSSLVGMMICRLTGEIIECNDKFLEMLGYSREEFEEGDLDWRILTPPGFEEVDERAVQQCRDQGFATPFEKEYYRKDGSTISVLIAPSGSIEIGLVSVFVLDITDAKRVESELAESRHQLIRSQKMEGIGRLAGGIAHDFNNLLTVINGYSDIALKKAGKNEPLIRSITEIGNAGKRATELTKQLLTFSRNQVIRTQSLNLNLLICEFETMLARLIGEDISFEIELEEKLFNIQADAGQFEQILLNFAVNAREAMPNGGQIRIATKNIWVDEKEAGALGIVAGDVVVLSFSDNGEGIPEHLRENIFEPFFTTKLNGTGLGLSTVYGIVTQFGGSLHVESEINEGTTLYAYFPAFRKTVARSVDSAPAVVRAANGETIMVVEDQDLVRRLTCDMLRSKGYNILAAENGKVGLDLINNSKEKIDLIVTDVVMPEMSGVTMIENIRKSHPNIGVIFMSGYPALESEDYGESIGDENFIQKPFVGDNLLGIVQKVLEIA
ncbi:MAG: PAS domain S-box protein [Pyrinomonadaceae bacterium]